MAKIYTPTISRSGLGIYESDNSEVIFIVEVKKRIQSSMYTYLLDSVDKVRNHYDALSAWEEVVHNLSADIEIVPVRELSKRFDIYKEGVKIAKDNRRELRQRLKGIVKEDRHDYLCEDLPWK